jgi:glyoxylase-like metal-dependent hydrolase (beta-lactamase superfamily II)
MGYLSRLNNVYVIDTNMLGFPNYNSAYLVVGDEIALIDTGEPDQFEAVSKGIKAHGFSLSDINYIFVTHCEHLDHAGNVAPILKQSPNAKVYINPIGDSYLTNPSGTNWGERFSAGALARRAGSKGMESVSPARIHHLKDGDVFDLGKGEKLRIIFAPGHQPSGIVIFEEKNQGLFINDLVGLCLADANVHYPLNPFGSDNIEAVKSLEKLLELPMACLYLGHYGIRQEPKEIMLRALGNLQKLLDIGRKWVSRGNPENIPDAVVEMITPELEKLRVGRGEKLYQYVAYEHVPFQAKLFARYCQERLK